MLKPGLAVAAAVAAADQASKAYLYDLLVVKGWRTIELLPFASLVTVWNYGVSFGMFNTGSAEAALVFVAIALAISALLVVWLRRAETVLVAISLGLVIGGAVGNVIDRLRWGAVFDFLLLYAGRWQWPAFNVADSAITVGVALLVVDALFGSGRSTK